MKKQRNYSQWKEQEKSAERVNNETDLSSLPDPDFKKKVIKVLKELRKIINRNADHCNKELETIEVPIKIRQLNCQDNNQAKGNE